MIAILLLAAAVPAPATVRAEPVEARAADTVLAARPSTSSGRTGEVSPVEAERAFAADAQKIGQWTAFRKWAVPDAIMFDPQPVKVSELLKDAKDPPKSVEWWPTASYISCDGKFAVNTGGWRRPNGSVGYFTTVWVKQADGGWKWAVDGGDALSAARSDAAAPAVRVATCGRSAVRIVVDAKPKDKFASGGSSDESLNWYWLVREDGARVFRVFLSTEFGLPDQVIDDLIAAPKPKAP